MINKEAPIYSHDERNTDTDPVNPHGIVLEGRTKEKVDDGPTVEAVIASVVDIRPTNEEAEVPKDSAPLNGIPRPELPPELRD